MGKIVYNQLFSGIKNISGKKQFINEIKKSTN